MELNAACLGGGVKEGCEVFRHSNRIGLTTISTPFSGRTFLKLSNPVVIMAKQEGGALPSSQGGLVQYMDADTGFEVDPKMVIAFGFLISVLGVGLHL
jgi:preprotein translocase subunit Sec61beta